MSADDQNATSAPAHSAVDVAELSDALAGLEAALTRRLQQFFKLSTSEDDTSWLPGADGQGALSRFVREHQLDRNAQLLVLLALMPRIKPDLVERIVQNVMPGAGDYPQLGGLRGRQHRGFLPTGDTALFLLAGDDLVERLRWQALLAGEHALVKAGLIYLEDALEGEPPMSGRLVLDDDCADLLVLGKSRVPRMSTRFPAQLLDTRLAWGDLILPARTLAQIQELQQWVQHGSTLMTRWGMGKKLRPGYRALFHGPPGTGKTLTAMLLGKATGHQVYKVDLSMVVSKYIGETEKNLATLFDKAEHKNWILFFDEADALFGKRTQVRDAHDRYANQEVSFLLQRVETYDGLVILASNLVGNLDEAFARRFEQLIHFPMPRPGERFQLWQKGFPPDVSIEAGVDLGQLAARHEVSGGTIMNVIRHTCLCAIARGDTVLRAHDINEALRREYAKENRLQ